MPKLRPGAKPPAGWDLIEPTLNEIDAKLRDGACSWWGGARRDGGARRRAPATIGRDATNGQARPPTHRGSCSWPAAVALTALHPPAPSASTRSLAAEAAPHEGKRKSEAVWPIFRFHHQRTRYVYEMYHRKKAISKELFDFCVAQGVADGALIARWRKPGYEKLCCLRCVQTKDTAFGTACICRVPRKELEAGRVVECQHCGCRGCATGDGADRDFVYEVTATLDEQAAAAAEEAKAAARAARAGGGGGGSSSSNSSAAAGGDGASSSSSSAAAAAAYFPPVSAAPAPHYPPPPPYGYPPPPPGAAGGPPPPPYGYPPPPPYGYPPPPHGYPPPPPYGYPPPPYGYPPPPPYGYPPHPAAPGAPVEAAAAAAEEGGASADDSGAQPVAEGSAGAAAAAGTAAAAAAVAPAAADTGDRGNGGDAGAGDAGAGAATPAASAAADGSG
jgi:bud site selection protein 31